MPVEIILTQFVENLGAEADVVKVKPGYARNCLIPKKLAKRATDANKAEVEQLRKVRAEREARELNEAQELASKLNKITLTFQMPVTEAGNKIFGSVTAQEVVQRLQEMGHTLDKRKLVLAQPLKTLGEHILSLNLGFGVQGKLKVVLDIPTQTKAQEDEKKEKREKKERSAAGAKSKETKEHKDKPGDKRTEKSRAKPTSKRDK